MHNSGGVYNFPETVTGEIEFRKNGGSTDFYICQKNILPIYSQNVKKSKSRKLILPFVGGLGTILATILGIKTCDIGY